MAWYCGDAALEDILLALETHQQTGVAVEELLALRADGRGWQAIWQDIGLVD